MKHLEFIQGVINRLSNNSFFVKGGVISLVSVLSSIKKDDGLSPLYLTLTCTIIFWLLDSSILYREKLFRRLYVKVAATKEEDIDFLMDISEFKSFRIFLRATFSFSLILFYAVIIIMDFLAGTL